MTTTATQTVHNLIAEALETTEDPTPGAIAEVVVDRLDAEQLRAEAKIGIAERVRVVYTRQRKRADAPPVGSSRWGEVVKRQESGDLDLDRLTIFNGAQTKRLLDCTTADLTGAIEDHNRIINGHRDSADRLSKLQRLMSRNKAETVRDLDAVKVREVFNA